MTAGQPAPSGSVLPSPGGLVLAPFRGLRFDTTVAGDLASLTSPPYDVISAEDVRRLEQSNPHNAVRLILPRDDPADTGATGAAGIGSRYRRAAETLAAWRAAGLLRADPVPTLYVYEEADGRHAQRGLVGALQLTPAEDGIVLPHENTMAGPVADRLALTEATQANLEPIFLVYDGGAAASAAVAAAGKSEPVAAATTDDGITHRLWGVTDPGELSAIAADLWPRRAVIADGHHRYATYLRHQADRHAAGAGPGPWDFGLAFLVDASVFGPQVHAIHRVLPGLAVTDAAARAERGFTVRRLDEPLADAQRRLRQAGVSGPAFLLVSDSARYLLTEPVPEVLARAVSTNRSAAWQRLDVTVAHRLLVGELWGLADSEDAVWYSHDVDDAVATATATDGTAVLLNPTPVEDVIAVAAAGERMPRKSTLFTPKPRTGLVMRAFADAEPGRFARAGR